MDDSCGEDWAKEITSLDRYMFKARTFSKDTPIVATVQRNPQAKRRGDEANKAALIKASLQLWGVKRKDAETKITKVLAV